jgi:sugar lactone lactonase YvrE
LNRFDPATGEHRQWALNTEAACCAPCPGGDLLLGMRDGLWRFDTRSGRRTAVAPPPYSPAEERFNDGKADPQGRFWVGTIDEAREPRAALFRWDAGKLVRMADGITNSNGLGWSPDGRTMYWSDTTAHRIFAFDFDPADGSLTGQRLLASFNPKTPRQDLSTYGGRPDGAAVDCEGGYWVAMFEGQRLLRLSAQGALLREVLLPVRCATMPCFGDADLRTLYVTTSRQNRPPAELDRQPWAGRVLRLRVDVAGLPVSFARP